MTPLSLGIFSRIGLRSTFQLLIALAAALAAASGFAATEVGALPGSFAVNATGAATYSIPIAAPAGIRGLNPHLALTYSSQSGNGLAGWGWNLAGLSAITVCPKTLDQDGVIQGISFAGQSNAANDFCLDGSKLMLANGSYGAAGSTYRKEIDDFSRVTAYTAGGVGASPSAGPQYFTVETGDGTTYEYGMTADSEIVAVGPDIASGIVVVRAWALDRSSRFLRCIKFWKDNLVKS